MVGRLIDDEHLLLYRMVFLGEQAYRQGLVVNVPALFRWLDESVVGGSDLADFVDRDFFTTRSGRGRIATTPTPSTISIASPSPSMRWRCA